MAEHLDSNYCQRCGQALEQREFEGKPRPTCPSCGFIVFLDPKVAVVVLVSDGDRLLFVQRGAEPQIGKWCFPGGYVDRGEQVEAAARREVREETGLKVEDYRAYRSLFVTVEPGYRHRVFRRGEEWRIDSWHGR